jgi:hypothetical protein
MNSFNKYLPITYYVLGTVLDTIHTLLDETHIVSDLVDLESTRKQRLLKSHEEM